MENSNDYSILDHPQVGAVVTIDASSTGEVGEPPGVAGNNLQTNEYFHRPVPSWLWSCSVGATFGH